MRTILVLGWVVAIIQLSERPTTLTFPPPLQFGEGSTNVWLSGARDWDSASISGADGDHAILIENVGYSGAQVSLGNGNASVVLGTKGSDRSTWVSGGKGDFRIKANDLNHITLDDGDHIINVGRVDGVQLGEGNSKVSFISEYGSVAARDGDHTFIGQVQKQGSVDIGFGNGNSVVQLIGQADYVSVYGGTGAHSVEIEHASGLDISLGFVDGRMSDGNQTVKIGQTGDNVYS